MDQVNNIGSDFFSLTQLQNLFMFPEEKKNELVHITRNAVIAYYHVNNAIFQIEFSKNSKNFHILKKYTSTHRQFF
jgi:hypothetical protein